MLKNTIEHVHVKSSFILQQNMRDITEVDEVVSPLRGYRDLH